MAHGATSVAVMSGSSVLLKAASQMESEPGAMRRLPMLREVRVMDNRLCGSSFMQTCFSEGRPVESVSASGGAGGGWEWRSHVDEETERKFDEQAQLESFAPVLGFALGSGTRC